MSLWSPWCLDLAKSDNKWHLRWIRWRSVVFVLAAYVFPGSLPFHLPSLFSISHLPSLFFSLLCSIFSHFSLNPIQSLPFPANPAWLLPVLEASAGITFHFVSLMMPGSKPFIGFELLHVELCLWNPKLVLSVVLTIWDGSTKGWESRSRWWDPSPLGNGRKHRQIGQLGC